MFSSRRSNNLINRIHEKSLRTVCNDTSSTFQKLLQRNRSVSIYHKNIQTLTTEMFKVVNNICHPNMKAFFDFRENRYNIKKFQEMRQQKISTIRYGPDMVPIWSRCGPDMVPIWSRYGPDMVSKQLFTALLNFGLLFLWI